MSSNVLIDDGSVEVYWCFLEDVVSGDVCGQIVLAFITGFFTQIIDGIDWMSLVVTACVTSGCYWDMPLHHQVLRKVRLGILEHSLRTQEGVRISNDG